MRGKGTHLQGHGGCVREIKLNPLLSYYLGPRFDRAGAVHGVHVAAPVRSVIEEENRPSPTRSCTEGVAELGVTELLEGAVVFPDKV